ncbi:MAG: hypothetical protein ABEJ85_00825, partial [Haloarculaceae archaeon]
MVMSVFAGTIAFTGTVAASSGTASASITPGGPVNESSTTTHDVEFVATGLNENNSGQTVTVTIYATNGASIQGTSGVTSNISSSNTNVQNGNLTFTLSPSSSPKDAQVNISDLEIKAPSVSSGSTTVNLNAKIEDSGGNDTDTTLASIQVDDTSSSVTADVTLDSTDNTDNGTIVYVGQSIKGTNFQNGEKVVLRKGTPGDSQFKAETTADDDGVVKVSTSGRATGDYFLQGQSSGNIVTFELAEHTISTALDPAEVGNAGDTTMSEYSVTTNRGGSFNVYVSTDGLSADQLVKIFDDNFSPSKVDLNADGTNDAVMISVSDSTSEDLNFTGITAGNYTLMTDVVDTDASASSNVTVTKVGAGTVSLGTNTVEVDQGDVATITVEFSEAASSGTLVIGDEDESGYQYNVSLTDGDGDGQVTVMFNTYTAGNNSRTIVEAADSEDDATMQGTATSLGSLLDTGDYGLAVSTADSTSATMDNPNDLGTLYIAERSTNSLTLWTAPASTTWDANDDDAVTAADIATLANSGSLTQDSAIATSDYVILDVDASGLGGIFEHYGTLQNAMDNGSVSMSMVQTNPGPNRDPKALNVSA